MGNLGVQLSASARARASLKRRTSRHRPRRSRPSCSKSRTFAALVTASATPPKVRRVARIVWNHARPSLARALPRRHSGLARLRSPLWLRSLPAGLLANARPPLPATAARQLPRLASRVAALRASARNVRHPARASCCNARCRLARSLNQALRAVSPRPASLRSPAPRPATATPSPRSRRRAKPSRSNLPALRAWRRRESAAIVPLPPYRQPRASGVERLALLARRIVQGRSPARPRAPQPREGTCCALRLPAGAEQLSSTRPDSSRTCELQVPTFCQQKTIPSDSCRFRKPQVKGSIPFSGSPPFPLKPA